MVGGSSSDIRSAVDMIAPLGFRMLHTSVDPFNSDPAYIAQVCLIIGNARAGGCTCLLYGTRYAHLCHSIPLLTRY